MCLETAKLYLNQLVPVFAMATVPALLLKKHEDCPGFSSKKSTRSKVGLPVPALRDFDYIVAGG